MPASEDPEEVELIAAQAVRGHLEQTGPATAAQLADLTALPGSAVQAALLRLESEGFALRGGFDPELAGEQWCSRRLLVRIHGYTQQRLRREIEPVSAQDLMRFLLRWQRLAPGSQREGRAGVAATVAQLQGFEIPVASWEAEILAPRVARYQSWLLDQLCMSGEVAWGRLRARDGGDPEGPTRGSGYPSRITPITITMRADLPWLLQAVRGDSAAAEPAPGASQDVLAALRESGALFTADLAGMARRMPSEVDAALWDLVGRGLVTADGFAAARALLFGSRQRSGASSRRGLRRGTTGLISGEGRWGLLPQPSPVADQEELAEAVAEQLLVRWGVVFRDLLVRESFSIPWR